jgi:hypothetical protein
MASNHKDNSRIIVDYILSLLRKEGIHCTIGTLYTNGETQLKSLRPIITLKTNKTQTIREKIVDMMYDGNPKHNQPIRLEQTREMRKKRKVFEPPYGEILEDVSNSKKFHLYHARGSEGEFPNNYKKPYFLYNWFSSYPFFDDAYGVLYQYELTKPISEMLVITKNHADDVNILNKFGVVIKKLLALADIDIEHNETKLFSDYAVAAFIVQIMKLNGLMIHDTFVILSKYSVDNFLEFTKMHKQTSKVGKNKSASVPEGENVYGVEPSDKEQAPIGFYTDDMIVKIRNAILKNTMKKKGGRKTKRKREIKKKKRRNHTKKTYRKK